MFETDDCFFDVYNLKIGTKYYWTVSITDRDGKVYKTKTEAFKTLDSYSGKTLKEKIYNYLVREIGVSGKSLDFIIDYLTE